MVIRAPSVLDASGMTVSAVLKVDGNAITMTVSPNESTEFPITAAVAVDAPDDKASAAKATEASYGLSDQKEQPFARELGGKLVDNLDPHLKSKPLEVKSARLILYYGTAPSNPRLNEWLKAVKKAGLTPFITLGRCEPTSESFKTATTIPCPEPGKKPKVPGLDEYRTDAKRLMKAFVNGKSEEPAVRFWGAWNEPDVGATSLHTHPAGATKAAYLWGEAQLAADEVGCAHHCDVVAGEFKEYGKDHEYIAQYEEAIVRGLRKGKFPVKSAPHFWGLHDYSDLYKVQITAEKGKEVLGNYMNREARGFAQHTRGMASFRSDHIWLSEQGVLLQFKEPTRLYGHTELQRLSAQDFLRLGRSSEHFERAYYYLYEGPTEKRLTEQGGKYKHEFDSALAHGEGVHEEQEPREAYCVLALGDSNGCP